MNHFIFLLFVALPAMFVGSASASEDKIGVLAQSPSLSPSGQELVFSANFDGHSRLWITGLDGSLLRKVSSLGNPAARVTDLEPTWSPDGRTIAYTSDGSTRDIWVVQADGTYPVKLTANGAKNGHPAWSPDGRKIAFESDKDGTRDIWIMNADGSQQVKVLSSSGVDNTPKFSPAGDQIVFSRTEDGANTLMIVNVNGTGLRALTAGNSRDWEPSWGSRGILFSSNRGPTSDSWKIWMIQPDGSNLRKVGDTEGHDPIWLPDGRIAFSADGGAASTALATVSILDPATGETRPVVDVQGYLTPIDIRPGKPSNQINPKSMGKAQIAILSTRTFDATKAVVQASITFGRTGAENSLTSCSKTFKDLDGDGLPDLTCRFSLRYAGFQMGNTVGVLRFMDARRRPYEGRDMITTGLGDDPDDLKD